MFTYSNGNGQTTTRTVEPLKLCFKGQAWYLHGYCKVKEDFRFFKLCRIKDLVPLEGDFTRLAPAKVFKEQSMFSEELITLTLQIDPKLAYRVYDEFEDYIQQADGSFIAKMVIPKGDWVYYYIASFGEHCQIIEPDEIRLEIKNKLQKIMDLYL